MTITVGKESILDLVSLSVSFKPLIGFLNKWIMDGPSPDLWLLSRVLSVETTDGKTRV